MRFFSLILTIALLVFTPSVFAISINSYPLEFEIQLEKNNIKGDLKVRAMLSCSAVERCAWGDCPVSYEEKEITVIMDKVDENNSIELYKVELKESISLSVFYPNFLYKDSGCLVKVTFSIEDRIKEAKAWTEYRSSHFSNIAFLDGITLSPSYSWTRGSEYPHCNVQEPNLCKQFLRMRPTTPVHPSLSENLISSETKYSYPRF